MVNATVPATLILPLIVMLPPEFKATFIVPVSVILAAELNVKCLAAVKVKVAFPLVEILLFTVISPLPSASP